MVKSRIFSSFFAFGCEEELPDELEVKLDDASDDALVGSVVSEHEAIVNPVISTVACRSNFVGVRIVQPPPNFRAMLPRDSAQRNGLVPRQSLGTRIHALPSQAEPGNENLLNTQVDIFDG